MPVIIKCKNCGEEFYDKLSHAKTRKYCSWDCRDKQRKGKSYEEFYGEEKAKRIRKEYSESRKKQIELHKNWKGCWICISHHLAGHGYPYMKINQKGIGIHRYMYEKYIGKIPEKLCVLHKCDNRRCINPEHLFLGTKSDNSMDMFLKGRAAKGERNASSKLTENDIREIRSLDYSYRNLGKMFNVSHRTISLIKNYKTWKHVSN
jgi:hypothetical protein